MRIAQILATLGKSTIIAQACTLLAIPILSRIYTPSSFAEYAFWVSFGGLVGGILSLKQENFFLSRPKSEWQRLISRILALHFIASIVFLVLMILFLVWGTSKQTLNFALTFFYCISTSIVLSMSNIANIEGEFIGLAKARVYTSVVLAGLQILLGLFLDSTVSLLVGALASQVTFAVALYFSVSKHLPKVSELSISMPAHADIKKSAASIFSSVTLSVATSFPPVLLYSLGFYLEAGAVSLLQRFLLAPINYLALPLSQAFIYYLKNEHTYKNNTKLSVALASFCVLIFLAYISGSYTLKELSFFSLILGSAWKNTDLLVVDFSVVYAAILIRIISSQYYSIKEQYQTIMKFDFIFVFSLFVTYILTKFSIFGYGSFVLGLNVSYVIYAALPAIFICCFQKNDYRVNA